MPDILALCETKRPPPPPAKKNMKKKEIIPGYEVLERNVKQGKEGLMIGVKKGTFCNMQDVTETDLKNLFTVRISYQNFVLRIILIHAPQETEKVDVRQEFFDELATQVERGLTSSDTTIVVGDFNSRIGEENGMISSLSGNGRLTAELIDHYNLCVCNFSNQAEGKSTRIRPNKDGSIDRSTIDYALVTSNIYPNIKSFLVDEGKFYCPYREIREKKVKRIVFSDHCALVLNLELDPGTLNKDSQQQRKVWNFTEDGYMKYEEESTTVFHLGENLVSTAAYDKWENEFKNILRKCFDKKTVGKANKPMTRNNNDVRKILKQLATKGRIQRKIAQVYMKHLVEIETRQRAYICAERLKTTMSQLSYNDKFSPNGYWKLKAAAGKRPRPEMNSVIKENGIEITGKMGILEAYKCEFQHRLRSRTPKPEWKEYEELLNETIRPWLKAECPRSPPFTIEELLKVIKRLKKGKAPGLDGYPAELFKRAGKGVLQAVLELFNIIKENREVPEQWHLMKIITIYKQKGSKKQLKYYRGIFLALAISKIFEGMIKQRIEPDLKKINILQAGSRSERSCADNVFLMRGTMDHYKFTKSPLYITAYDYEQAFDSLWVEDCILSLRNLGVSQEMLQLVYSLNKKAKVVVDTPYGYTSEFETGPIVKQGTVLGSVLCSASTGEYCGINTGVVIGTLQLSSLLYVDDKIDMSSSLLSRSSSHCNAVTFSHSKKLTCSGTKCYSMGLNIGHDSLPELLIDPDAGTMVTPAGEVVYLGDIFNDKGNNDGLIKDRVDRGVKAIISITALLLESDLGKYHFNVALLLYQALFLSTVLFNSQTWSNLRNKDYDQLKKLQSKFIKRIVGVSYSTCTAFTFLELGILPIECEIHIRQLNYLHRILNLPEDDPVHEMWKNMTVFSECGEVNWWTGVSNLLEKYGLHQDLDKVKEMSKASFKELVKKQVRQYALNELLAECQSKKKTGNLTYSELKLDSYFTTMFPCDSKLYFSSVVLVTLTLKITEPTNTRTSCVILWQK